MIRGFLFAVLLIGPTVPPGEPADAECAKYFHDACSEAIGAWLPRVPATAAIVWGAHADVAISPVRDQIVDPAGRGPEVFEDIYAIFGGTKFVYGTAGPPQGKLVYDPTARIALYDEGCCSWHHVVLASDITPPPKRVVARSLTAIQTKLGMKLGVPSSVVIAVFGPAPLFAIVGHPDEAMLAYRRPVKYANVSPECDDTYTFLFKHRRLAMIDDGAEC